MYIRITYLLVNKNVVHTIIGIQSITIGTKIMLFITIAKDY